MFASRQLLLFAVAGVVAVLGAAASAASPEARAVRPSSIRGADGSLSPPQHTTVARRSVDAGAPPRLQRRRTTSSRTSTADGIPARAKNVDTVAPKEGGVLSPVQFRPKALQLSLPFSVVGLALNFLLYFLMLRGSAAIDDQARRATAMNK